MNFTIKKIFMFQKEFTVITYMCHVRYDIKGCVLVHHQHTKKLHSKKCDK